MALNYCFCAPGPSVIHYALETLGKSWANSSLAAFSGAMNLRVNEERGARGGEK